MSPREGRVHETSARQRLDAALETVRDPEIPVLTIGELGILREAVVAADGHAVVTICPTYSGCPAIETIRADITSAVSRAGLPGVRVRVDRAAVWSSRWLGAPAREKLARAGIAPPADPPEPESTPARQHGPTLLAIPLPPPPCPRCGGNGTRELARFGSTLCTSLWRCGDCGEPFDHFKEH